MMKPDSIYTVEVHLKEGINFYGAWNYLRNQFHLGALFCFPEIIIFDEVRRNYGIPEEEEISALPYVERVIIREKPPVSISPSPL